MPIEAVPLSSGLYATIDDMIATWGDALMLDLSNRRKNQETMDRQRIGRALEESRVELHAMLQAGPYAVPLVGLSMEDHVLLRAIHCKWALSWLYKTRVGIALDAQGRPIIHPAAGHVEEAKKLVRNINAGYIRLSANRRYAGPTGIVGIQL